VTALNPADAPARSLPACRRDAEPRPGDGRPRIDGKLLAVAGRRLTLRGVTYGTFEPDARGDRYPGQGRVEADFAAMAEAGVNAVRVYTVPPRRVLDAALHAGLWVLAGLPWEQHVAFLDRAGDIAARVADAARTCAGHPAVLGYAIGNEIPAAIVRWQGRRRVERFLATLAGDVRDADPGALVTYVSFPSTEYLDVPAADVVAFNVYLEDPKRFAGYVARLQNLAGERPLLVAEVGLDSARNGEAVQAQTLEAELTAAFELGCAGAFAFAWTDEWHRGEDEVLDWDFGLCGRDRAPKPALEAVANAFAAVPARPPQPAPLMSVVICTHNGEATLTDCLEGVAALRYPAYETIVVDDGSTDATAAIAADAGARVISTPNRGLSAARNTGAEAARGDIVAYVDDDARPDPDWLTYLALAFARTSHAAVGGPNLPPASDGAVARAVADSPGGPIHVLLSDTEAEHLPGCNLAVRRDALLEIGGFDPRFRVAGDDVDVCWRLTDAGHTLGFHPAALVWHRRRASVRGYWRQQRGYGRAEALLERKWPEKYAAGGNTTWGGRLYGRGVGGRLRPRRVYHGVFGAGAFQPEHDRPDPLLAELAAAPEWLLVIAALAATSALGLSWHPLLAALAPLAVAAGALVAHAAAGARGADANRALTFALHLAQPAARLAGRLRAGLVPWRRGPARGFARPTSRDTERWTERWSDPAARLHALRTALGDDGLRVRTGGPYDRWDLQATAGALGGIRLRSVVEEHGRGRQLARYRITPRVPRVLATAVAGLFAVAGGAAAAHALIAAAGVAATAAALVVAATVECGIATAGALRALDAS
jgi:GT2 family glycosyltransferase